MKGVSSVLALVLILAIAVPSFWLASQAEPHERVNIFPDYLLPLGGTLLVSLLVGAGGLLAAWRLHRREHRMASQLVAVAALAGGAATWMLVDAANVIYDESAPVRYQATFREVTESKNDVTYHFDWDGPGESVAVSDLGVPLTLRPGDRVRITMRRGALGWPYLTAVERAP